MSSDSLVTRFLLFLLFFVMLLADTLGLNLSLAPGLSVKNAFLYLILLIIAMQTALTRNRNLELLSIVVPYALCIFYAMFTWVIVVIFIKYPGFSDLGSLINLKGGLADHLVVFLVFFYGVLNSKDALWLLQLMIWIVVVGNFISVVDDLNLPDLGLINERGDGRIGGPIGEPNQYAAFLAMFLPAALGLAMVQRGVRRGLAILGFATSVLAFMMAASRGGIVGVVGGAALGAVFLRQFISGKVIVSAIGKMFALAVVAVGVLYIAGYGDLLYERIIGISITGDSYNVSSGRTVIWVVALDKMFEQPLTLITGYGWDTYRHFPEFNLAPHNSYLKIFFELGLIGLVLVLVAFANILRVAREGLRQAESESAIMLFAFVFGLLGILVAIFFIDLYSPWLFIWAYAGVAMRLAVLQGELPVAGASHRHRTAAGSPTGVTRPT